MIAAAFSRVADRLLAADPGLVRLHTALRVALACLLTGVASIAWTASRHHPITLAAPGILFAMVAPLFVRDARRPAWFGTLVCLYLCACACFAAASVLSRFPLAGDAGFLVVMFVGMLCQACGPRALGCAMLGVVCFYLGLYLHPSTTHLVQSLLLSAFGPLMVALVGRVIVPTRAATSLRLAVHTVTLRASRVLHAPVAAHLSALNEAALSLEEQLALLNPSDAETIRERIAEVEVAAGQYAFASGHADGGVEANARVLRHAIARLRETAHQGNDARRAAFAPAGGAVALTASQRFADLRSKLCWLPATRATTAALLAMLIGHSLSPERWFWAVITTFVVFLGTRSRADTVYRGAQRLVGTLGGALVSVSLVAPLQDSPVLLVAAMLLCVFGWAYFILNAYAPGVFFITVLVGLVYGELGFAMGPLVELRIEEVLVGCVVSFAVAILMMPLAATRHVETRLASVLGALREVVRLTGSGALAADALPAMRKLDRSWHDLRIALRPLQTQRVVVWNPDVELATGSLLCCLHWARVLSDSARRGGLREKTALNAAEVGAAHVESIVARLDSLIARYNGVARAAGGDSDERASVTIDADIDVHKAPALAQLDGAVAQLFDRLMRPVSDARRVFNWTLRGRSV
ncbi:fusaric acid resistance family protein [Paraburkholderia xenovorans LB400]|uniref:Membrane protein n=1 Tax=Paraburkholderia xenovorans (strain LB400) TaxID=266265 RepID=Q13R83_PARXL|nr:FUSC family protein [Paraburkholderia xenovorans]ABE33406.1 Putative membrane protein [Paraburkholderia xenovorans LB400]AIP36650.1 fusaric acid resistance family protein [Paraburkholderia xenovorans LB400]